MPDRPPGRRPAEPGRRPAIASLPMYHRLELVEAHNRYWALIGAGLTAAGISAPPRLDQEADPITTWSAPGLVLGQTCGMPYRCDLHGLVALIGTPDYGLSDCRPGYYRSAIVVRRTGRRPEVSDYADAVFAYNQDHSQSGFAAPYHHTVGFGFWFATVTRSGSHRRSIEMVADGRADIAAIDAVTWRLACLHDRLTDELEVIDWTKQTPGLPYIAAAGADRAATVAAVASAIERLEPADRDTLGLRGLVEIPAAAYLRVPNPPAGALDGR